MGRREDILARLRTALQLYDPEWDAAPGTPEHKILEAVANEIDSVTYDSVLSDYGFDINKKSGLELDAFVGMFGFTRIMAKRASGFVTFSRGVTADTNYSIPYGTQVSVPATSVSPAIAFQTTAAVVLASGSSQVDVPVEAVIAGTSGNTAAGAIRNIITQLPGITAVTNNGPIIGGTDGESDSELRARWKTTVFRNLAGTEDQFLALAFNEPEVTQATVVGASERFVEQLQVPVANVGSGWTEVAQTVSTQSLRAAAYRPTNTLHAVVGDAGTIITSTNDGSSWTRQTSNTVEQLLDVTYHTTPDVFVALGYNTLLYSQAGTSWTASTTGANTYLRGSAFNASTLCVVVGDSGTILSSTYSSGFGAWSAASSIPTSQNLNSVVFGDSIFVAVGNGGTIITSSDGSTWTARTSATASNLYDVKYSSAFDLFVAVGVGGTILTSPDGVSWTARTSNAASDLSRVAWASASNTFVITATNGNVLVSSDGINWTQVATGSPSALYGVTYASTPARFIAVGGSGAIYSASDPRAASAYKMRSQVPDSKYTFSSGSEFLSRYAGTLDERMGYPNTDYTYITSASAPFQPTVQILSNTAGAGLNGDFPAGAVLDFQHEYTPDSSRNDPASGVVDKVDLFISGTRPTNVVEEVAMLKTDTFTFGAPGALLGTTTTTTEADAFATLSGTTTSPAVVSNSDGWIKRTSLSPSTTATFNDGAFTANGATAVVVGNSGKVYYSTTAPFSSWTGAGTYTNAWYGVDYHSSTFLAVGASGLIAASSNGTTWPASATSTGAGTSLRQSAYSGSLYVAVGDGGKIVTSSNLTSWTVTTSGTTQNLRSVIYVSGKGFIAVGASGTIVTSSDGTTWTTLASVTSRDLNYITYSAELDLLVAVGSNNTILTSNNATSWTVRVPSGAITNLLGVAWASGLSLLVATTENRRIYTSPDGVAWTLAGLTLDENGTRIDYNATTGFLTSGANGYIATAIKDPLTVSSTTVSSDRSLAALNAEAKSPTITPGATSVRVDFYGYRDITGTTANGAPSVTLTAYNETDSANAVTPVVASMALGAWTARSSLTGRVNSIAYGRGTYVAVGAGGKIWTSPSYLGPWTERSSGTSSDLNSITYGKDASGIGVFVAVGVGGIAVTSITPTTSWTARSTGLATMNAVTNGGGTFVAVGASGAIRYITATPHGSTAWTTVTAGSATLNGVAYSAGTAQWVAVGNSGAMYYSSNGTTWTSKTSGFSTTNINAVATDGATTTSTWVMVGDAGKIGYSTTVSAATPTVTLPTGIFSGSPALYTVASGPAASWFVGGAGGVAATASPVATWTAASIGVGASNAIRASVRGTDGWIAMGDSGLYATAVSSTTSSKVGSINFTGAAGKTYSLRFKWSGNSGGFLPFLDKIVVTVANPLGTGDQSASYGVRLTEFVRDDGFTIPAAGNYFMRLFKAPIVALPDTLTINDTTYIKNVNYWLVRDTTLLRGSTRASEGIEWKASTSPEAGTIVSVPYSYNSLVERLHEQINLVRLVGTDTLVHEGQRMRTRFNLALVVQRGVAVDTVKTQLEDVLTNWLATKSFRNDLQIADLYDKAYLVRGIDNIRLVQGSEARNAQQRLVLTDATAGSFRLTFLGSTTGDIAYSASAATVQSALEGLSTISTGNVAVTGTPGDWVVSFVAGLGQRPVPMFTDSYGSSPHNGDFAIIEIQTGIGQGIQMIAENGIGILSTYTSDIYMKSNQIPVFHDLSILPRAQNTF